MAESKAALAFLRALLARDEPPPLPLPAELAPRIVADAREQGIAGLVHEAVASTAEGRRDPSWPPEIRKALLRERRVALVRGVRQLGLAARVLARLDGAGLRALPLKGAALLESLYDSEGDRAMADVDVLVLDDWRQALGLLRADGFAEGPGSDHVAVLWEPGTGAVLELHHSVTSSPGLFPLDADGLWSRSVPGKGQVPRLPSPEDLLVHLALHAAFQHGLVLSLAQWLDFRRLLERRSLDPGRLAIAAASARADRPLAAALAAAKAVVGARVRDGSVPEAPRDAWMAGLGEGDPLRFVAPVEPDLAHVRMALLPGRRLELLRRTLFSRPPGARAATLGDLGRGAARAVALLRRWGPQALETLAASAPRDRPAPPPPTRTPVDESRAEGVLRDCLGRFPFVQLTVTGDCMRPSLAEGDRVRLVSPETRPPRVGDVVLARLPGGLRLHRLVWGPPIALPGTLWRTQADRGALWDPALRPADVLATVDSVDGPGDRGAVRRPGLSFRSLARGLRSWLRLRPRRAR